MVWPSSTHGLHGQRQTRRHTTEICKLLTTIRQKTLTLARPRVWRTLVFLRASPATISRGLASDRMSVLGVFMIGLGSRRLAALVLIVFLGACKKEGGAGDTADLPAEMKPHPAQGDPSKLAMPAVMAHVPADTPYLLAGLDAIPPEFYAKLQQMLAPIAGLVSDQWRNQRSDNKLFDSVLSELDGKWNQAGMESLGFSAQPRFALYGLGLAPMVVRMAVKDHKVVQATIERIAARAGEELPAMASKDGHNYWQHTKDDGTSFVIALADNQVIFAIGKATDVDAKLGLILGIDKPAHSMADGAQVKQLMARHGFGGHLIGFADTRQIAGKALAAAGRAPSPACSTELDRLSATLPRLVFGYGELSPAKISGGMVVELSPDAVAALRSLKVEISGLGPALSGHPLFAMAGGVDLAKAQQLGVAIAGHLKQLGAACELGPLADGADRAAHSLGKPLPDPVGQIAGVTLVLHDLVLGARRQDGIPEKVDGFVAIASPDPRGLYNKVSAMDPQTKSLGVVTDGKMHPVNLPMALPFAVSAGIGDRSIVVTTGDKSRAAAEKLLGARGGGKAPLFAMGYDAGKLMDLVMQSQDMQRRGGTDPKFLVFFNQVKSLFGYLSGTLDVTEHGLALWSTIELH